MTVAVYNLTGEARIPAYVWTAVLGVSVALHIALLAYGISLKFNNDAQDPDLAQTEIVIESEGPVFETAEQVQSVVADVAQPDSVPLPAPNRTELQPVTPDVAEQTLSPAATEQPLTPAVSELQPAQVEAIRPVESETAVSGAVPPRLQDVVAAEVVQSKPVGAEEAETAAQPIADTAVAAPVEKVVAARPETAVEVQQNSSGVASPAATVVTGISPDVVVVEAVPEETAPSAAEPDTVVAIESAVPELAGNEVAVVTSVQPSVQAAQDAIPSAVTPPQVSVAPPVETVTAATSPVPVTTTTSSAPLAAITAGTSAVQTVTSTEATQSVAVAASAPVSQVESETVAAANAEPVQAAPANVQAVTPAEEQLAAVQPSQIISPSVLPSDPETSSVPPAPTVAVPEPSVPPEDVPTIDPLAKVTKYVANYDIGSCAHITVLAAGTDTAEILAFGVGIPRFMEFYSKFQGAQGYDPDMQVRPISNGQCAVLDTLETSKGIEAPGLVQLARTNIRSGSQLAGVIQRDLPIGRIAQAEAAGLELNGKGPPELYLIDRDGQIHDAREYVQPENSTDRIGGWRFSFPLSFPGNEENEYSLILTIWNRPKENQPAPFTKRAAGRIASVLEKPGVYSIEAFKVSR
ncbi:MAG: hypothetical protein RDA78_22980 [Roseibium sp.]|uniref:hypothetical protein n=1 Tax=Roseibium sp. TaxID=1936156 RepID=UPI003D9C524D